MLYGKNNWPSRRRHSGKSGPCVQGPSPNNTRTRPPKLARIGSSVTRTRCAAARVTSAQTTSPNCALSWPTSSASACSSTVASTSPSRSLTGRPNCAGEVAGGRRVRLLNVFSGWLVAVSPGGRHYHPTKTTHAPAHRSARDNCPSLQGVEGRRGFSLASRSPDLGILTRLMPDRVEAVPPAILCFGEVLWDVFRDREVIGGAPFNVAASPETIPEYSAALLAQLAGLP